MKKAITYLLCFAAFLAPLRASFLSIQIGGFQLSPFRLVILLAFVLHCLFNDHKNINVSRLTLPVVFLFFWLFYAVFSILWVKDYGSWFKNVFFLAFGAIEVLLYSKYFRRIDSIKNVTLFFCFGILIQALIGWYEVFTKNYLFLEMDYGQTLYYVDGTSRIPIAMHHNPNNYATLMFAGVCVSFFQMSVSKKKIAKVFFAIALCQFIALLILTQSRANILALIATSFLYLFFRYKKKFVFFTLTIIILLFAISYTRNYIFDRISGLFSSKDLGDSQSDLIRMNLIKNALYFVGRTFGMGVGAGQSEYWMENYPVFYTYNVTNIHNWWIELLANYGLIIFFGYLFIYISVFLTFFKQRKNNNPKQKRMCLFLSCFLVGYIISCISPSSMMSIEWSWIFFSFLILYSNYVSATKCSSYLKPFSKSLSLKDYEYISNCSLSK